MSVFLCNEDATLQWHWDEQECTLFLLLHIYRQIEEQLIRLGILHVEILDESRINPVLNRVNGIVESVLPSVVPLFAIIEFYVREEQTTCVSSNTYFES